MSTILTRMFASPAQAQAALKEMRLHRLHDEFVSIITPPPTAAPPATDVEAEVPAPPPPRAKPPLAPIVDALVQAEVPLASAIVYAEAVRDGGTAMVVRAPFGFALMATQAMARNGGTDLGIADHETFAARRDPAAPFSSLWDWPVLSSNPTPLSSWLGWRVLSERQTPKVTVSNDPAPLSGRLGWKLLSPDAAPLSARFGWRLTLDNPAPLSSRLGWPVLSSRQHGRGNLIHDPAPFSNFIGWQLLSKNPAPLSSLFGWKVLSDRQKPPPHH